MVDYFQYVVLSTLFPAAILWAERKQAAHYAALGAFAVLCAMFGEPAGRFMGFWDYSAGPFFFGASVFTIVNYFNYMIVVYFIANKAYGRLSRWT